MGLVSVVTAGLTGSVLAACSASQPKTGPLPATVSLPAKTPPDAAVASSITAADAGLPRFYVIASQGAPNGLQVRGSATGELISTVTSPGTCMPATYQVAAAGNDRDFIFSCLSLTSRKNDYYRLQLSPRGAITRITSLPIPPISSTFVTGLAVTPDGRKLAIGLTTSVGQHATVEVVTLASGAIRSWTAHMDRPTGLTWVNNGRDLGFWSWGLRELDVNAAGGNLASARLISRMAHSKVFVEDALLSPDGTTVMAEVDYQLPRGTRPAKSTVIGGIAEMSAATGKVLRLFIPQHVQGNAVYPCQLGPIDASGHHLLAGCTQFDRIDWGRVTPLAGNDIQSVFSGAW
jgi:hypothetical protein